MMQLQVPKDVAIQRQIQMAQETQLYSTAFQVYLQLIGGLTSQCINGFGSMTMPDTDIKCLLMNEDTIYPINALAQISIDCAEVFHATVENHRKEKTKKGE